MRTLEIIKALNELLEPEKFKDYAPNGLQVEGNSETQCVLCGVTASEELIDKAIELGAQTILVHHGYFWKNEDPRLIGIKRNRLKKLLEHNINLVAYHLPLDVNTRLGNNVELAKKLKLVDAKPLEEEPMVWMGELPNSLSIEELSNKLETNLNRQPVVFSVDLRTFVKTVALCSGAAQDFFETAVRAGAQAYLSGEVSERTVLEARELKIPYFCIGHHASEVLGIRALSEWLANRFPSLSVGFLDIPNPV